MQVMVEGSGLNGIAFSTAALEAKHKEVIL